MAKTVKRPNVPKKAKTKRPALKRRAVGVVSTNFHEGSRSEVLADYLFSMWGTVTPVRRQSDYGLDLYCTLTERVGRLSRVRDYFAVQVKSTDDPWEFNDGPSVKWLIEHPIPLFLCIVSKKEGTRSRLPRLSEIRGLGLGRIAESARAATRYRPRWKLDGVGYGLELLAVGTHNPSESRRPYQY